MWTGRMMDGRCVHPPVDGQICLGLSACRRLPTCRSPAGNPCGLRALVKLLEASTVSPQSVD